MAERTVDDLHSQSADAGRPSDDSLGEILHMLLAPIASLRLTVALFALAILLIFFGTLAQVGKDIWEVMDLYFRCPVAWVPVQIFFPKVFFPTMEPIADRWGFYFPGGFLIGGVMVANLLAAHGIRFKIQAQGRRLVAGLVVLVLGALLGWLVVMGGSDKDVVEGVSSATSDMLWMSIELALGALWLTILYGWWFADPSLPRQRAALAGLAVVIGAVLWALLYFGSAASPDPSGMRILLQITKATAVSLVLLAGCILVFRHRAAIVLLHAGVGLMIANELVVYMLHSEGTMRIAEGETKDFTEDIRTTELAVIGPADKTTDEVTVVPKRLLIASAAAWKKSEQAEAKSAETGGESDAAPLKIASEYLPCDIEVLAYYLNSKVRAAGPHEPNLATAGVGRKAIVEELRQAGGVDNSKEVDIPSAYVRLFDKKTHKPVGDYLVSMELPPDTIELNGKKYELSLRFKRNYKPYAVKLLDVRKDDYIGTSKTRNYSSDIKLIYPDNQGDRKVSIWMNNPLRYAGETFYQSGYHKLGNREYTTLQVVKNTGWMIPYLGCMIVVVGMGVRFGTTLVRFLQARASISSLADFSAAALFFYLGGSFGFLLWKHGKAKTVANAEREARQRSQRGKDKDKEPPVAVSRRPTATEVLGVVLPILAIVVLAGGLASRARVPKPVAGQFNLYQFGELPIVSEGRVKPIDTLARNTLRILTGGKQTYVDQDGKRQPAIRWLLDLIAARKVAFQQAVIRIDNPEVLNALGLKKRDEPDDAQDDAAAKDGDEKEVARPGSLYSLVELMPRMQELIQQAEKARDTDSHRLTTFQKKILDLDNKTRLCSLLLTSFQPPEIRPDHLREDFLAAREQLQSLDSRPARRVVPPQSSDDQWQTYALAIFRGEIEAMQGIVASPGTVAWEQMLRSYARDNAADFNQAVADYQEILAKVPAKELNNKKVQFEAMFNHGEPFYLALYLDGTAFLLTALALFGFSRVLNRTALWLLILTFAVHTLGLVARIYISGRPPVTNLYSSALFIGWAAMIFGIVFEAIFRLGIGNLIASLAGFVTLMIAHFLSGDGDTFTVLEAVLDTQFWLATHVVCVTCGYAATFVAGLLSIAYVVAGTVSWLKSSPSALVRGLGVLFVVCLFSIVVGAVCVALLSIIGWQWGSWCALADSIGSAVVFGTWIFSGANTPTMTRESSKIFVRMIYGTVCFAMFFSFFGTVLGGLWADDSWGRFWGWDPKENGALIIVIWNALVLHARWGGMIRDRGLAVLAMVGNIVTAWSWFGVNELGAGLHSYGFTEGVAKALGITILIQLALVGLGMLPKDRRTVLPQVGALAAK